MTLKFAVSYVRLSGGPRTAGHGGQWRVLAIDRAQWAHLVPE